MDSPKYDHVSIIEAAQIQVTTQFVDNILGMNSDIALKRLVGLVLQNVQDASFINIAGQFNALIEVKTSYDDMELP